MSTLDVWTLALAVVGATTGVAALVTQVWSLVLSGPRVRVAVGNGFAPGQDGWLLTVDASNVGRLPVTILEQGIAFRAGGKWKHAPVGMMPEGTSNLPGGTHRLPDGEAVTWVLTLGPIAASVADAGARKVHAYVRLATGKNLRSRRAVDVVRLARLR